MLPQNKILRQQRKRWEFSQSFAKYLYADSKSPVSYITWILEQGSIVVSELLSQEHLLSQCEDWNFQERFSQHIHNWGTEPESRTLCMQ